MRCHIRSGFIRVRRVSFGVFCLGAALLLGHRALQTVTSCRYVPSSRLARSQNPLKPAFPGLMKPLLETFWRMAASGKAAMKFKGVPSDSMKSLRLAFCFYWGLAAAVMAAEYPVSSAAEISARLARLQPGDTLVVRDGEWKDQVIEFQGRGVANKPITLRAATAGNTILTGASTILVT